MTDYILTAVRFTQVLERNDQGRATKEIKHRQGALITDLDEQEARRLLVAGAIRPAGDADAVDDDSDHGASTSAEGAPQTPIDDAPVAPPAAPADQPRKPRVTATAEKWLAYAKTVPGIDADTLDGKDKDEIIALVEAAEQK